MLPVERQIKELPQISCPVAHYWGAGIYIREVVIPAGTVAIGRYHKKEHINVMLRGKFATIDNKGDEVILTAPLVFTGKPGKKFGVAIDTTVWLNIYKTDCKTLEGVEREIFEDDPELDELFRQAIDKDLEKIQADREDFKDIPYCSYGPEFCELMNNVPMVSVRPSPIHGKGLYTNVPLKAGDIIGLVILDGRITKGLGEYVNHSKEPNCEPYIVRGNVFLRAKCGIIGSVGGDYGTELTINYRLLGDLKWLE